MKINVRYFAKLREQAGQSTEILEGDFKRPDEVFRFLQQKYSFEIEQDILRVSINGVYRAFDTELNEGDIVVFIPPVAGG